MHPHDPELKVNVRFVTEICDELRDLGMRDAEFFQMGTRSLIRNYGTSAGQRLRASRSARELLESCFTEIVHTYYDRNSTYRLKHLGPSTATVDIFPNAEVCDQLQSNRIGSRLTCLNRAGGFSSLTGYLRLPFMQIRETRCIHQGDDYCRVTFDFTHAKEMEKRAQTF